VSPEQALGPRVLVDQRTDVYSLGVTLYELLTLEPACKGQSRQEILSQLASGMPPRAPRRLVTSIPVALETICLRALANNASDRYATSGELADDLRRFLEDRPIRARRTSLVQRGRQWLRRHWVVARAAAAVVVIAVAALVTSTVLIARQRDEAQRRRNQAQKAVDRMYVDVAEKWLAQQPHLEPLQREYLLLALEFYEELIEQTGPAAELRLATAQAARRVGDIRQRLGEREPAEPAYRRALELLRRLAAEHPDRPDVRADLAVTLNHSGNLQRRSGALAEAYQTYRQARDTFAALVRESSEPAYRNGLAGSYNNLGVVGHNLGKWRKAEDAYRRALNLLRQLVDADPRRPGYRHDLASSYNNLGCLLHELNRHREAEMAYKAALVLWSGLTQEQPAIVVYQQAEATCMHNLGRLRAASGKSQEALQPYRLALTRRTKLAENFPRVPGYRQDLAATSHALGVLLAELLQFTEAEVLQRQAFVLRKELAKAIPQVLEHQHELAASHHGFGWLLAATGRTRQAEEAYQAALALPSPIGEQAAVWKDLGRLWSSTGRTAEAEKAHRKAAALMKRNANEG
jgi:tetratricopeptide (TPR) repeat protein